MKRIRWIIGLIGVPFLLLCFYCSYFCYYAAIEQNWEKFVPLLVFTIVGFVGAVATGFTLMFIDCKKKKDERQR